MRENQLADRLRQAGFNVTAVVKNCVTVDGVVHVLLTKKGAYVAASRHVNDQNELRLVSYPRAAGWDDLVATLKLPLGLRCEYESDKGHDANYVLARTVAGRNVSHCCSDCGFFNPGWALMADACDHGVPPTETCARCDRAPST